MAATIPATVEEPQFTLVLDAGHGGSDPGNLGTGRYKETEKNVALDVTLMVGEYISENYPDVKIVYTRKSDTFPTLNKRVEIANASNADLFISIHCNAAENKSASGVETFVMGLHKSEESLKNAMKENASIFLEKDHEKTYAGFNPGDPDTYIILSMRENAYLDQSIVLAKSVQDQFRTRVGRKDRGVKQAGFYVISFTNMPSILVELGFLSNSEEEDFLNSKDGKSYLASAIYRSFKEFKEKDDIKRGLKAGRDNIAMTNQPPVMKEETPVKNAVPVENAKAQTVVVWNNVPKGIKYQVQILSSPKHLDAKAPEFKGVEKAEEFKQNGVFKYLVGSTTSYQEAKNMQQELRDKGFKDAFVVAFENGQRIDLSKAISLTAN